MPSIRILGQETRVGKTVNWLKRHPDSEVAALARELVESFKSACHRQRKAAKKSRGVALRA